MGKRDGQFIQRRITKYTETKLELDINHLSYAFGILWVGFIQMVQESQTPKRQHGCFLSSSFVFQMEHCPQTVPAKTLGLIHVKTA